MKKLFLILVILVIASPVFATDYSGSYYLGQEGGMTWASWEGMWTDFRITTNNFTGNTTVYVSPGVFEETTAPPQVGNLDLSGYTLTIKPFVNTGLRSTDGNTGPRFKLAYSAADEFLDLRPSDSSGGTIIIEGLYIEDVSGTSPSSIFTVLSTAVSDANVIIRNNVLVGRDTADGIYLYCDGSTNARIYNNVIRDFDEGILVDSIGINDGHVSHNTVVGCATDGIDLGGATITRVYNNIATGSGTADFANVASSTGFNNMSSDETADDFSGDDGTEVLSAGNQFTRPGDHEYFLSAGVDAVNAGAVPSYSSLVGRWRFERDTDGTPILTDDSANSNALTAQDDAVSKFTYVDGTASADFESTTDTDYYDRAEADLTDDFPGEDGNVSDLTITAYIKFEADNNALESLATKWSSDDTPKGWLFGSNGAQQPVFYWNSWTNVSTGATSMALNTWYFVACRLDVSEGISYVYAYDNTTKALWSTGTHDSADTTYDDGGEPFRIGALYASGAVASFADGLIDDVRVHNSYLAKGDIELILDCATDMFGRPRDASPDIGAFEHIEPVSLYITTVAGGGANTNDGDAYNEAWANFANTDYRVFNPGDTIYLLKDASWGTDHLLVNAVGSIDNPVTITQYDAGGSADPMLSGTAAYGLQLAGAHVDVSDIDIEGIVGSGLYIAGSYDINVSNLDILRSYITGTWEQQQAAAASGYNNGSTGRGVSLWHSSYGTISNCTINWNDSIGIIFYGYSDYNTITNCTLMYNGLVGLDPMAEAIRARLFGQTTGNVIRGCTIQHTGHQHISMGPSTTVEDCVLEYSGNGYSSVGAVVFGGTGVGTLAASSADSRYGTGGGSDYDFNVPEEDRVTKYYVKGETSGAIGYIHLIRSSKHYVSGHRYFADNGYMSVIPTTPGTFDESAEKICLCATPTDSTCTGTPQCDTNYWQADELRDYIYDAAWASGAVDILYADDSIVRRNKIGYHSVPKDIPYDGYGIALDQATDGAVVNNNWIYKTAGEGIHCHLCGENEACTIANNSMFDACMDSIIQPCGGIFIKSTAYANGVNVINNAVSMSKRVHDTSYVYLIGDVNDVDKTDYNFLYQYGLASYTVAMVGSQHPDSIETTDLTPCPLGYDDTTDYKYVATKFTATGTYTIDTLDVWIDSVLNPTATITAEIWTDDSGPDEEIYDGVASDPITPITASSYEWITFSGMDYDVIDTNSYWIVLITSGVDGDNYWWWDKKESEEGVEFSANGSDWTVHDASAGCMFKLYGDTEYTGTTESFTLFKSKVSDDANSSFSTNPQFNSPPSDLSPGPSSAMIEGGGDASSYIGCTANSTCYDIDGQQVPIDGDKNLTESWDIGADEYRYPGLLGGPYGWTITGGAIQGGAQ